MASRSRGGVTSSWALRISILMLSSSSLVSAQLPTLDLDSPDSIKAVAGKISNDMLSFYTGNHTGDVPGNLPQPYYWWEAGAMMGSLIDYWYYTGDNSNNALIEQAMLWQMGPDKDYMTPNQTKTTGNDDQAFWAFSAMTAAENKFPDPKGSNPGWLELAQAVFNTQAPRWDTQYCNGGLRWQVFTFNNGYDYKNTISNGCFFNLAARLALYTGNQTYADWANKAYDWTMNSGFMTQDYHFYDGAHTTENCSDVNKIQWTYNVGVYLGGAAAMWNLTSDETWKTRVLGMLNGSNVFFYPPDNKVMYEVACEGPGTCNTDNFSFKAYLSRWMALCSKIAPFTHDIIMPRLRASAAAAVKQCVGGATQTFCGMKWTDNGKYDGTKGVGQQMGVLEVVQSNLIDTVGGPVSSNKGGISKGNAAAGGDGSGGSKPSNLREVATSDRAGAGILTALVLIWIVGGLWWMMI